MKPQYHLLAALLLWLCSTAVSAQRVTLDEIQRKVEENWPLIAQYNIIEKTKDFNLANANRAYLPQGRLSAQATMQSDVTKVELDLPEGMQIFDIPVPEKDQYNIVAELTQLIWDGGTVSAHKKGAKAAAEVEKKQLDTEIYALRERVNNLYFGVLLMKGNLQQQEILESELQRNYENVKSYLLNGLANEADLSVVKVEQLRSKQQRIQLEATLEAYMKMLSLLSGESLDEETIFEKPECEIEPVAITINRPELNMFTAQVKLIESQRSLLKANNMPQLGAFAQGGYGKPGLNMFNNDFLPYIIGGVRLTWNFSNLYRLSNEQKIINLKRQAVITQRETFLHNLDLQISQQQIEIERYRKSMLDDEEIIEHLTLIRKAAEVKVENGTMTVSDLMKEINAEEAAKQAKLLHEIQYLMSIYSLKHTVNQ